MTLAPGQQIGSYTIERALGSGGMGVVYIVVDNRLGRRAAIKQLLPAFSGDHEIVERFFNEAKAAASINHPSIVEIYDVGWHVDGSAYFAMKLLEGESLARRMRTTRGLPIEIAATIARQVAAALGAAHARGIVHRDLKPDNIMLVRDDEVVIGERAIVLDFGIAKLFADGAASSKTKTGTFMGTPAYMSPEQCRGAGDVDQRSDVYALGCILFEMLTGRPPFIAQGSGEIVGMHQFVEPPALRSMRDVPPELDALVARTLAKQPEARIASMTDFAIALRPFAVQGVHTAPPIAGMATQLTMPPGLVTTHASSSGEIAKRPTPGMRVPTFVLGVIVALAGTAITIVATCQGAHTDDADEDVGTKSVEELRQQARAAFAKQQWDTATRAAQKWLALAPADQDAIKLHGDAMNELEYKRALRDLQEAKQDKKWLRGVEYFRKIPRQSVYHQRAIDHFKDIEHAYIDAHEKQAKAWADSGDCVQLQTLLQEATQVSQATYEALNYRCIPSAP